MTLTQRIAADHAAVLEQLPETVAPVERRRAAFALVGDMGLPTSRDENWRYANLRALEKQRFTPVLETLDASGLALPPAIEGFDRHVFVDGRFAPHLSAPVGERHGVTVRAQALSTTPLDELRGDARFAAVNLAFATDALEVTATSADARGVEVVFIATQPGQTAASYPRLQVHTARGARLRLIERHVGPGDSAAFVNAAITVDLAEGSQLEHVRWQSADPQTHFIDTLLGNVATDAAYTLHHVSLGAQAARSTTRVRLAGERATFRLGAVTVVEGIQVCDSYALVEHAAPATQTHETFRGVAGGRSRVAFNGHIVMRPGAVKSASAQTLRSLLAGPGAEANMRPQLEIYTDDVQASHGATAGKLDDAMLFYLLSRGIERSTAQSLLKWAFLGEIVSRIGIAPLRVQIEQAIAAKFKGGDADVARELL